MAREVRKTVTVLFADVVGSTALGEELDPETLRRVLARWFDTARETLERHGASVEKFIGDAVMAVFGVPQAHEDDALRAVRAAVELRERLGALNAELEREHGVTVEARTGINTGRVVTGTEERLVTGDAVNVAARLEEAAGAGEILIGESTFALVRDAIEAESLELPVRGKADAVEARRLLRLAGDAAPVSRRVDAPLVGRSGELDALRAAYGSTVAERACRVLTVLGPPGIGKSRLAAELTREIGGEATVLLGRCLPYGEGITYWPLVEIVRAAAHHEARARIVELLEGAEDAELVADRLAAAVGTGQGAAATEEIFWAVRRLFERLARERPLVVVLEDIHWGEPTFLELLEYVAAWTTDAPVLLLCLARPDLVEDRPAWLAVGRTLALEPLSHDESLALAESLGDGEVDEEARHRMVERAEGNPLFLEQLLAIAGEGGDDVPPSIQAVLAARLDRLPADERSVLERGSVIGREFWRGAVSDLAPTEERASVASSLLALARKGLVRPERSVFPGEDGFRFHHALIRDAAYDAIPKATRAELHEQAARWLADRDRALEREHDEIVGYHLEQAYRYRTQLGPVDESARTLAREAAERLAAAGERAASRTDMRAVANLLGRASDLVAPTDPLRLETAGRLANALRSTGELERAEAVLAEAVAAAESVGDERLRARAQTVRLEMDLGRTEADPEAIRREAEALRQVFEQAEDDLGLAGTWSVLAQVAWLEARADETARALERAIEHCRRGGAEAEEVQQLEMLVMTYSHGPMPVGEGIRRCEELRRSAGSAPLLEAAVERALGRFAAMRGRPDEAREHMARGIDLLQELGLAAIAAATGGQGHAFVESLAGNSAAAEHVLRASYEQLEAMGEEGFLSTTAAVLAEVVFEQGRLDEAERLTEASERFAAPGDISSQAELRAVRARILARREDFDEAERLAREAVDLMRQSDFLNLKAGTLFALAEVLWQRGRREEAAAVADEALALLEAKGNVALLERLRGTIVDLTGR